MQVSSCAPGRRGAHDEPKVARLWGDGERSETMGTEISRKKKDGCLPPPTRTHNSELSKDN